MLAGHTPGCVRADRKAEAGRGNRGTGCRETAARGPVGQAFYVCGMGRCAHRTRCFIRPVTSDSQSTAGKLSPEQRVWEAGRHGGATLGRRRGGRFRTQLQDAESEGHRRADLNMRPGLCQAPINAPEKAVYLGGQHLHLVIAQQIGLSRHMTLATKTNGLLRLCKAGAVDITARLCEVWSTQRFDTGTRGAMTGYASGTEHLLSRDRIRATVVRNGRQATAGTKAAVLFTPSSPIAGPHAGMVATRPSMMLVANRAVRRKSRQSLRPGS